MHDLPGGQIGYVAGANGIGNRDARRGSAINHREARRLAYALISPE